MRQEIKLQDPDEKLPYGVSVLGDVITSADWSIDPSGPTISDTAVRAGGAEAMVSGVEEGQQYVLRCKITSTSGGKFVRSIAIRGARQ